MNNMSAEIIKNALDVLGFDRDSIPDFPVDFHPGFQCVFIQRDPPVHEDTDNVTVSCMGKTWSSHGLFPATKDPLRSVFDECPFFWLMGFSHTSHFDYIYYLDVRDPKVKIYYRGEYGFYGEDRREEISAGFALALLEYEKCKRAGIEAEIVFHARDFIVREKTEFGFQNRPIYFLKDFFK
ncbi:MAG: hypothetical protein K8T10_11260 [Candidatus Eremiobacteraeota bacterium]|nr:hypothetical protein [Candidatus Eremiobacteraeota bacterium]